jgi:hypothetical protein
MTASAGKGVAKAVDGAKHTNAAAMAATRLPLLEVMIPLSSNSSGKA